MTIQTDNFTEQRIIAPTPASPNEEAIERALRPKHLEEYVGQEKVRGQLEIFITAARQRQGSAGSHFAIRPTGFGQDYLGAYHRPRNGREFAPDFRAGAGARWRFGRAADQSRSQRCAVHRRDPSTFTRGRRNSVSGAGRLPDRYHDRRRAVRAFGKTGFAAVHAGRRHHARRHADQPAARPLRHRRPSGILYAAGIDPYRHAQRRRC